MTEATLSKPARIRRTAADRALDALIELPVGAFCSLAQSLAAEHPDVAKMFQTRLNEACERPRGTNG